MYLERKLISKSSTNFEHIYSKHNSTDPDKFSGQGVNISDPRLQMSQGALQATGGALDLAVTGLGFFPVVQGDQVDKPYFTRDGSFNIKANGQVVTNDGLSVMGFMGDDKGILKNLVIFLIEYKNICILLTYIFTIF